MIWKIKLTVNSNEMHHSDLIGFKSGTRKEVAKIMRIKLDVQNSIMADKVLIKEERKLYLKILFLASLSLNTFINGKGSSVFLKEFLCTDFFFFFSQGVHSVFWYISIK